MSQILFSCKAKITATEEQLPLVSVKTSEVKQGDIESTISLNGKTIYLKKNSIVSPIPGYIIKMNIRFGEVVQKNDILFEIQTKENKALENINSDNQTLGIVKVMAPAGGVINELIINETGGYIVEGGILCSIVETNDLVIQMNMPFQFNDIMKKDMKCKIILPDNTDVYGYVYKILPIINETSQTQNVLIIPETSRQLPENLNLVVQFTKEKHTGSFIVAKDGVMTNEIQSEFWVMKVSGQKLAVKIPVIKGLENDSLVEISSPELNINDLIITEGAYGLADSTAINIEK
jgi:biotin carboxyl carrier protein